jgi:hypothetical protein
VFCFSSIRDLCSAIIRAASGAIIPASSTAVRCYRFLSKQSPLKGAGLQRWNSRRESQHGYRFKTVKAALALNPRLAFGFTSAAHAVTLPKLKPWAMREGFVVPSIGGRDVACAEWPDIRRFEHFL